jgi:PAS domain S-box-containing protein
MIAGLVKQGVPGTTGQGTASDEFLQAIVDACASRVAVLSDTGDILYASSAWRKFERNNSLKTHPIGALPHYFNEFHRVIDSPGDIEATLADDIRRILAGVEKESHRKYFYFGLNEPRNFMMHAARLNVPGLGFRVLITQREANHTREALHASEERLNQLLETTKIMVWEAEPRAWQFSYVSPQALKTFGYELLEWYEPNFLSLHIHPEDRQTALSFCGEQNRISDHYDLTFRMISRDGRVVWVQNLVSVTRENGKPVGLRGYMVDISERKEAEEALRDLGGRLIAAQEEERRRVARELHDDLNQRMALMSIELEQIGQQIQKPSNLRRRFQKLQTQAQEISADIHRLSYKLHPSKLDHLGLAAAVKSLCAELTQSQKLRVELHVKGVPADLPATITLCVFRICQEALRNCVRHSGSQTAHVTLEGCERFLRLTVSDNGSGFDPDSEHTKKGLGFISMKERLHLVGGQIQIFSKPQRGTRIEVSIPLTAEK